MLKGVDIYCSPQGGVIDVVTVGADKKIVWWELTDTSASAYKTIEGGVKSLCDLFV